MQTKDIYGKTLSNSFESAITSVSQYIKPQAIADFKDARHLANISVYTFGEGESFVSLNGTASSHAYSPDRNELDIVGDIEVVARIKANDWTPASTQCIASKWFYTLQSWRFDLNSNGSLSFTTTTSGSDIVTISSGTFVPWQTRFDTYWVKVTLDVANGTDRVYKFYWADNQENEPNTWTLISNQAVAGTTSIYSSIARMEIGSQGTGFDLFNGNIYRVIVRNGIGGSIVADFNPNDSFSSSDTSWYSSSPTGETWNLLSNVSLTSKHYSPTSIANFERTGYIKCPALIYSYDRPEFDDIIPAELQIIARLESPLWEYDPTSYRGPFPIISKWDPDTGNASYILYHDELTNHLVLAISGNGVDSPSSFFETFKCYVGPTSGGGGSDPGLVNGRRLWIKVVADLSTSGGKSVSFYIADDQEEEPENWNLLVKRIPANVGPIYNGTSLLRIGTAESGSDFPASDPPRTFESFVGKIFYVKLIDGIASPTVVAEFNPAEAKEINNTNFISSSPTGETWYVYSGAYDPISFKPQYPNLNYFFSPNELVSSAEYETFAWGVAGAKDQKGQIINASGKYVAMPSSLEENLKYGWWGTTLSNASKATSLEGSGVRIKFDPTIVNKIKVVTPSLYGPVETFSLKVYSASLGIVHNATYTFNIKNGEYEKLINLNTTYTDINLIIIRALTTFNKEDYSRFLSVSPIYQVDISDYISSLEVSRVRDLHETSLPIAGTSQTSATLSVDNTDKLFNPLQTTSEYGKYLEKDIKIKISQGWKTLPKAPDSISTFLTANVAASGETYINVNNATFFPDGDTANTGLQSNYYIVTIDAGNSSEEKVLIKKKIDNLQLEIVQRGFANTANVAHSANAVVSFDPFEYTPLGDFYIEEISTESSSMVTSITLQDKFKFLNDKTIDYGYFRQDVTVPSAISDLLMLGNFPRKDIITFNRYSDSPLLNEAILQLKCDDKSKNGLNSNIVEGLRFRVHIPTETVIQDLFDFKLDSREKELTDLEKAMGIVNYVNPNLDIVKSNINLSNYQLTSDYFGSDARNTFYQGVFDGYLIPNATTSSQSIGFNVINGAARLYIDDQLVVDQWNQRYLNSGTSNNIDFKYGNIPTVAGVPMKLRFEFLHALNSNISTTLVYTSNSNVIPSSHFVTNIINDNVGVRALSSSNVLYNYHKNDGVATTYVSLQNDSSISWNINDKSIYISNSHANGNVLSYVRIPYSNSIDPSNSTLYPVGDWAVEVLFKAPDGAYGGQGEYISSYSNANSTVGFELFYISSTNHGIRVRPAGNVGAANITVTSNIAMPNSGNSWNHVIASYNSYDNTIYYYVNGILNASQSCSGQTPSFIGRSITIGGRGADYTAGSGPVLPTSTVNSSGINLYVDEFTIYKKYINTEQALNRYIETQIKEIKKFPFLYAFKDSIYQSILNISFADLGRLYINESSKAIYESYYAFFESSINQHANVQQSLSDSEFIVNASLTKALQINSVIVKVAGVSSKNNSFQSIWRAPDNTTLGVVTLTADITNTSNIINASSFNLIPFPKSGFIIIDDEIIKYSGISSTAFTNCERAQLGTYASAHFANTTIREVRAYDFEFDKTPAFAVKDPFITGILFEDPDEVEIINWEYSPYKGNLIVAASQFIQSNSVVFLEGVNPLTEEVAYTSIAGIPVQVSENTGQIKEQKAINSDSRRKYGLKEFTIESPFITDTVFAQEIADFIISKLSEPIPILTMETILTPKLQVGDRIKLTSLDQLSISNTEYWITSIDCSIGSGYSQTLQLRKVV